MSNELALHDMSGRLAHAEDRFNALAQVAGREMPRYLKPAVVAPVTIGLAVLGAAVEARFNTPTSPRGTIANGLMAAIAYGVGFMAGENADLRAGAYAIAVGLGSSAAAIGTYDKVTSMMANTTAPAPAAA